MMVGKDELQKTPWTWSTFKKALEHDLPRCDEPPHSRSAIQVVSILADHLSHLRALGRTEEIRRFSDGLHQFLLDHGDLARLSDLDPKTQVAVRLDVLFQDLYAAERVPTADAARELLSRRRGGETRLKTLQYLAQCDDWVAVADLVPRVADPLQEKKSSRQLVHQTLAPLREAGLVYKMSSGPHVRHRITAFGKQIVQELTDTAERVVAAEPSLLFKISQTIAQKVNDTKVPDVLSGE